MSVDITPIMNALVAVVAACILGLSPFVAPAIINYFKISKDSVLATRVETGVKALAQVGVAEATSLGQHNDVITSSHPAVVKALTQASAGFTAAQSALGITDATIAQRVAGQMTALLTPAPITLTPSVKVS